MNAIPIVRTAEHVTAWHLFLVLAFMVSPYLLMLRPSPPPESVFIVDFVVDPTPFGAGTPDDAPETPPAPDPVVVMDAPDAVARPAPPKPTPQVELTKPKVEKPKIEVSKVKVKRPLGEAAATTRPGRPDGLTPEEIRRRLAMGARVGTFNSAIPSDAQLEFGRIYRLLYDAWEQPSAAAVRGATVTAELGFGPDGSIVRRRLAKPSGMPDFDRSVDRALKAVDRIPGLPLSFVDKHPVVTILFEVQD